MTKKPSMVIESDASTQGWGGILRGNTNRWSLVSRGETVAYQLHGSCSSLPRSKMLCQRQEEHCSPTQNGQHHSSDVCEQAGWNSVSQVEHHCQGTMALVHELGYYFGSGASTGSSQYKCGSRIPSNERLVRLDVESQDLQQDPSEMGSTKMDMFASRLAAQLKRFLSWRPDPEAEALDAFNQNWASLQGRGYANPPWNLVGKVLNRVRQQQVTLVLVAPVWKSQPWYPILLDMLVDFPILIPHKEDLIIPTHPEGVPAVLPQLAAWLISGNASKAKRFLRRAQSCCLHHENKSLQNSTTHYSRSGLTGVMNGTQIPFQDL